MASALLFTRATVAAVFAVAVVAKVMRFRPFVESLGPFGVPGALRSSVAGLVLLAETAASALLIGPAAGIGFALADGLLLTFSIAIYSRLRAGAAAHACNCFGEDRIHMDASGIWRNVILLWVASAGLAVSLVPESTDSRIHTGESATIILFAAVVAIGMIRLPSIARAVAAGATKL